MEVVFSGIQPTGHLTIGNYLGAMKNWVAMQDKNHCIYCIVDLHAITMPQDPNALKQACIANLALYIASGIDPKKSIIFIQSSVTAHAELAWIFGCFTPMGWLKRMTQFKDKASKNIENVDLGLFSYPTLMAADILLYHATGVPVGEDQTQHVELTRDIAGAFNRKYNIEYFKLPNVVAIPKESMRIMSLRDGHKKMSKSDSSDMSRINMTDETDLIIQKIKKATTDTILGITYDPQNRPEIANLLNIYSSFANKPIDELLNNYERQPTSKFKQDLSEVVISVLSPIQVEFKKLMNDRKYLEEVAGIGCKKANEIADKTLNEVKEIVGLFNKF